MSSGSTGWRRSPPRSSTTVRSRSREPQGCCCRSGCGCSTRPWRCFLTAFCAAPTASSAVDRKITHQIRLVLTDFPDEHTQVVVDRRVSRPPEPQPGVALEYLLKLKDRIGTSGLEAVIEHLWNAREACSFSHPRQAVEILERLHHDRYLIMRIRKDDPVALEDALDFLDGRGHQGREAMGGRAQPRPGNRLQAPRDPAGLGIARGGRRGHPQLARDGGRPGHVPQRGAKPRQSRPGQEGPGHPGAPGQPAQSRLAAEAAAHPGQHR